MLSGNSARYTVKLDKTVYAPATFDFNTSWTFPVTSYYYQNIPILRIKKSTDTEPRDYRIAATSDTATRPLRSIGFASCQTQDKTKVRLALMIVPYSTTNYGYNAMQLTWSGTKISSEKSVTLGTQSNKTIQGTFSNKYTIRWWDLGSVTGQVSLGYYSGSGQDTFTSIIELPGNYTSDGKSSSGVFHTWKIGTTLPDATASITDLFAHYRIY